MGMAASQARYLALTARKTNTEWEGQQINQARTALANQSAGLFNRLLNMEVPNAPKTSDYTKLQYSYSDGENESVFESWHQINHADPNYNYVVSHYYMADVFTGIKKLLQDPQVQINEVINKMVYEKSTTTASKDLSGNLIVNYKINDYGYDQKYDIITAEKIAGDETLKDALTDFEKSINMVKPDGSLVTDGVFGYKDEDSNWHFFLANEYTKITPDHTDYNKINNYKKAYEKYALDNNLITQDPELTFDGIYKTPDGNGSWNFVNINEYTKLTAANTETAGAEELKNALYNYEKENNLLTLDYNNVYSRLDGNTIKIAQRVSAEDAAAKGAEFINELKSYQVSNGIINAEDEVNYDAGLNLYYVQNPDGSWSFEQSTDYTQITNASTPAVKNALSDYEYNNNIISLNYDNIYTKENIDGTREFVNLANYTPVYKNEVDTAAQDALKTALKEYETERGILNPNGSINFNNVYGKQDENGNWHFVDTNGYTALTEGDVQGDLALENVLRAYEEEHGLLNPNGSINYDNVYGYKDNENIWNVVSTTGYNQLTAADVDTTAQDAIKTPLTKFEIDHDLLAKDPVLNYDGIYSYQNPDGSYGFINTNDYTQITQAAVNQNENLKNQLTEYERTHNLLDTNGNLTFDGIYGEDNGTGVWNFTNTGDYSKVTAQSIDSRNEQSLTEALYKYETEHKLLNDDGSINYDGIYGFQDSDLDWHFMVDKLTTAESITIPRDYTDYSPVFGPSQVGNSQLTELNELIVDKSRGIDQVSDLAQILRDCPDSNINKYVRFDTEGNLIYDGKGIYTFDLLGKTYYASKDDLLESATNAKKPNSIDNQPKLAYYSASYIPTKIEETNEAMVETDSNGRFTSVKFDNDSTVYSLNVEEVTNEAAYNDAMNAYLHKKDVYEKTIAEINAKTSLIQRQDRTLELRLKQLDTEQNALATEMDAVKKVIKDNVEKTFKTFSD